MVVEFLFLEFEILTEGTECEEDESEEEKSDDPILLNFDNGKDEVYRAE